MRRINFSYCLEWIFDDLQSLSHLPSIFPPKCFLSLFFSDHWTTSNPWLNNPTATALPSLTCVVLQSSSQSFTTCWFLQWYKVTKLDHITAWLWITNNWIHGGWRKMISPTPFPQITSSLFCNRIQSQSLSFAYLSWVEIPST